MRPLNTKNKTMLFVLAVMIVASSILVGTIYLNQKNKLREAQIGYYTAVKKSYEKILKRHDDLYYVLAIANIESKGVKEVLYAKERSRLRELNEGRWESLKEGYVNLTIMHFHLPDGSSFLRMHDPERFGDPIAAVRPMVAKIHQLKEPLHGFETGTTDLAYRTIVPIRYEGAYIGALELGIRPDDIFSEMAYFNELHGALFVKRDSSQRNGGSDQLRIGEYTLQFQTLKNRELLDALKEGGYDFQHFKSLMFEGKTYGVYSFDMHDFEGKTTAKAVFFQNITELEEGFHETLRDLILLLIALLAALMVVIDWGFRKILTVLDRTNRELVDSKEFLQSIFDTSKDGIALLDLQTNFLYFNNSYLEMTGFTQEELLGKSCAGLSAPEDFPRAIEALEAVMKKGFVENFEKTCIVKDGKKVMINMSIALMPDKQHILITTKNITEAKKLERKLKDYIELVDHNVIISTTDTLGNITYVSEAFCNVTGYGSDELLGRTHRIIRHADMEDKLYKEMWEAITQDRIWEGEIKNRTKEGGFFWSKVRFHPIYDENGIKTGYTAIREDITDKKRIEEISITDGLTGIYNRRYFNDMFPKILGSAKRNGERLCLLVLDIDYFKQYNDCFGHQKGDEVLIRVAQAIHAQLKRGDDYCFRLGGEEFGILFKTEEMATALAFAEQIRQAVEELGMEHPGNRMSPYVTVSLGVACGSAVEILNEDALYKEADMYLYQAKEAGRNRVVGGLL